MAGTGGIKGTVYQKILRINSENKTSGTTGDFKVNFGNNLQKIRKLSPVSVQFYNVFYNVFSNSIKQNNQFLISLDGGASTTITITPGYYTAAQLMSAIAAAILASPLAATFTFTMNTITNKVEIKTNATGTTWTLTNQTGSSVESNPWVLLGFPSGTSISATGSTSTATYMPDMNHVKIAYIRSGALAPTNAFDEAGSFNNFVVACPVDQPFGSMVTWRCMQDVLCEIDYGRVRPLSEIDITLVDHEGVPLDLAGTGLNLEFKVYYNDY